ncbi:hypothetical protein P152DRAFT_471292 [Eremomyces bilateralis CBS 781.70]|uniref:Rab-GAP TBC domain-containing protein n=1 Tax=Eremomyces bilateralis CBS 781.70 TaxID=1392243 RepID=A0A6G1GDC8_9PEZI|nr:uncharacterized protein P152DRAFT_471292 [Eremomyces bilateralis CBS 781.70]KAF1815916.1 hypothetical protein P152DRAFT_471292 [Eremomyces bilateralis CBS 781.70]
MASTVSYGHDQITNHPHDADPGSPPDLTNSKSSKSSSFHSSNLAEPAGPTDISHFEDITLDDLHNTYSSDVYEKKATDYRPTIRESTSSMASSRSSTQSIPTLRDLTNRSRPKYPSLKGHVSSVPRDAPPPNGSRRGVTGPSPISLPHRGPRNPTSRSPSPGSRHIGNSSANSSLRGESPAPRISHRRPTWKPGRKSVKELEDEYHDSDEDVPDDAVIWNVPLSPRPLLDRSLSASPDPRSQTSLLARSPEGFSPYPSEQLRSAPAGQTTSPSGTTPPQSLRDRIPKSASATCLVEERPYHNTRTKSWTEALSDLSDDARNLTEALESYAESGDRAHEANVQSGRLNLAKTQSYPSGDPYNPARSKSGKSISLPPLRRGDIMIDPLPISKEKEKVLTRTRPSWLPPKNPLEEKKHLKEWQRMMAHAAEIEKRRAATAQAQNVAKDTSQASLARLWSDHVLPNWNTAINEPRIRELWWRGITPRLRGEVWSRAIGNELALTHTSFEAALGRARAARARVEQERRPSSAFENENSPGTERQESRLFATIDALALETHPSLRLFAPTGPFHAPLIDVLSAYAYYRTDVEFPAPRDSSIPSSPLATTIPLHLIAALLLLNLPDAPSAFIALSNILNRPLPLAYLIHDPSAIARAHDRIRSALRYKRPGLASHLFDPPDRPSTDSDVGRGPRETVEVGMVRRAMDRMLAGLFTDGLDVEVASRMWDVYVFEGDGAFVRGAVGVLISLEGKLWGGTEEVAKALESEDGWAVGEVEAFLGTVREAGKMERRREKDG